MRLFTKIIGSKEILTTKNITKKKIVKYIIIMGNSRQSRFINNNQNIKMKFDNIIL